MKRASSIFLVVMLLISSVAVSFAQDQVGIYLDGTAVTFTQDSGFPYIDENSRTQVPLRMTMETAGYIVTWDGEQRIASVSDGAGTQVHVKIGDDYITKEVTEGDRTEVSRIKNDTFSRVINGRTFLPIRVVLEAFGSVVTWDGYGRNVFIDSTGGPDAGGHTGSVMNAEEIYAQFSPSVFYIEMYDSYGDFMGTGSGFFISADGVALTNYHVVEYASYASVVTVDGGVYDVAGLMDYDVEFDLAKLKVDGKGFRPIPIKQSPVVAGGGAAYAIGSPLGLQNTISEGIISNPYRTLDGVGYYQVTTPISGGSSGGPLFNKYGEVIGITTAMVEGGQNLNLAIPIDNVRALTGTRVTPLSDVAPPYDYDDDFDYSVYDMPGYYTGYYPAPDFGYALSVPEYDFFESYMGMSAYYRVSDVERNTEVEDYLDTYVQLVELLGFEYGGSFDDEYGNLVLFFSEEYSGLTLYLSLYDHVYGGPCYRIMVLWDY